MVPATSGQRTMIGPRKRPNDERVDEPAKLIENELAEVERETLPEDNHPVEQVEDKNRSNSPAFEE
jgi:hypothetical protein